MSIYLPHGEKRTPYVDDRIAQQSVQHFPIQPGAAVLGVCLGQLSELHDGLQTLKSDFDLPSKPVYMKNDCFVNRSRVMRKLNSVTYKVGSVKAEQAQGMFGLTADQRVVSCLSRVTFARFDGLPAKNVIKNRAEWQITT